MSMDDRTAETNLEMFSRFGKNCTAQFPNLSPRKHKIESRLTQPTKQNDSLSAERQLLFDQVNMFGVLPQEEKQGVQKRRNVMCIKDKSIGVTSSFSSVSRAKRDLVLASKTDPPEAAKYFPRFNQLEPYDINKSTFIRSTGTISMYSSITKPRTKPPSPKFKNSKNLCERIVRVLEKDDDYGTIKAREVSFSQKLRTLSPHKRTISQEPKPTKSQAHHHKTTSIGNSQILGGKSLLNTQPDMFQHTTDYSPPESPLILGKFASLTATPGKGKKWYKIPKEKKEKKLYKSSVDKRKAGILGAKEILLKGGMMTTGVLSPLHQKGKHGHAATSRQTTKFDFDDSFLKTGYKTAYTFTKHHVIQENEDNYICEPNGIPNTIPRHMQNITFLRSPKRKPFFEDGRTINEKRFQVNHEAVFPEVLSNIKHIRKINMKKESPRVKSHFDGNDLPFDYPNMKDLILEKKGKGIMRFDQVPGRIQQKSIYKEFVPPDIYNYDNFMFGYEQLGHIPKAVGFSMGNMKSRDDAMYRVNEGYKMSVDSVNNNPLDEGMHRVIKDISVKKSALLRSMP